MGKGGKELNIFNRRELYLTMDLLKFNEVINILNEHKISYSYKTFSTSGVNSGTIQSIGLNTKCMVQYYIYVHKKDYKTACLAINRNY